MVRQQYIAKCDITGYFIETIFDNNVAYLENIVSDMVHIKPLVRLIRITSDEMANRKISVVRQTVFYNDWEKELKNKTSWKVITEQDEYGVCNIECPAQDFLYNWGKVLNIL